MTKRKLLVERDWWNYFSSPESLGEKADYDQMGADLRLILLEHSLSEWLLCWSDDLREGDFPEDSWYSYLNGIHPNALELVGKYGVAQKPHLFNEPPCWGEPVSRACFGNASALMRFMNQRLRQQKTKERLFYVEGVALGGPVWPMHHAWNSLGMEVDKHVLDWTFYATSGWLSYLGIPLSQSEYHRARNYAYPDGKFHLLFKSDVFPKIESYLSDLLAARKEQERQMAAA